MDETKCKNCGEGKWRHYEVPILEGEKPFWECAIVRDSGINYRFVAKSREVNEKGIGK